MLRGRNCSRFDIEADEDEAEGAAVQMVTPANTGTIHSSPCVLAAGRSESQTWHGGVCRSEVVNWMIGVCSGLQYLHDYKPMIIHRDLKPANIILSGRHFPVLFIPGSIGSVPPLISQSIFLPLHPSDAVTRATLKRRAAQSNAS